MSGLPTMGAVELALGTAVVHFLWQGALIGVVGSLVLRCLPRSASGARYGTACGALLVAVVVFVATLVPALRAETAGLAWDLPEGDWTAGLMGLPDADLRGLEDLGLLIPGEGSVVEDRFGPMRALGWVWIVGFCALALRWIRGVAWTFRIRRGTAVPADAPWQRMLDEVRRELGVRTRLRILVRDSMDSPAVVGWMAPVLVLPLYALTSLTPEQLRCVFAHELAHVRRFDTWVNGMQAWAEALLFFHPVTWWLSKVIREEREHCCDASAVRVTGAPRRLAEALTCLETLRTQRSATALAAEATGGHLMKRIQRILDPRSTQLDRPIRWRSGSVLAAGALAFAMGMTQVAVAGSPAPGWAAEEPSIHDDGDQDARVAEYRRIAVRIEEAVEAGALSGEAAEQTLLALRKSMFRGSEPRGGSDPRFVKYKALEGEIREAVRAGKISKEEAEEKLHEVRREVFGEPAAGQGARRSTSGDQAEAKIMRAIEMGLLTPEEGKAKLAAFHAAMREEALEAKKREYADRYERLGESLEQAESKIKRAIEQGLLTREEGKAKLAALREMSREEALEAKKREYAERYERLGESRGESGNFGFMERRDLRESGRSRFSRGELRSTTEGSIDDLGLAEGKIKRAIESGRISKAEAEGLLEELDRERGRAARADARASLEEAKEKLEQAIRSGRISKDEGRAKLESMRRELDHERELGELRRREERDARELDRDRWRESERLERRPSRYREERRDRSDAADPGDRRSRSDRMDRDDRWEQRERLGRFERSERWDQDDRRDRAERRERDDRFDRPDRSDRPDRLDREERRERKDGGEEEASSTVGVVRLVQAEGSR